MAGANFVGLDKGFKLNPAAAQAIYRFVELTAFDTVTQCNAITDLAIGVTQERIDASDAATGNVTIDVRMLGISLVEVGSANGGVIGLGAFVAPAADGRAQVAAATQNAAGIALQASTAAGQWIPVFLVPSARATAIGTA